MVALRQRMQNLYADWRDDLPEEPLGADGQPEEGWRTFFAHCPPPHFGAVPEALQIAEGTLVWPGRKGADLQGAPASAHVCRAFEGIRPDRVKAVVLGQDPYPEIAQATGRAFEDGAWNAGGRPQDLAKSLKPLMLAAWATQPDHAGAFRRGGWPDLVRTPDFALPEPVAHFNALAGEGVLFVNAAWTRTEGEHLAAHRSLWKPVLDHMLQKLAGNNQAVVFLLLGNDARKVFCAADPVCRCSAIVDSAHPGRGERFGRRNPLERVNHALGELGDDPVRWWPDLPQAPA